MNIKRNKTYNAKLDEVGGGWVVVDAADKPLGRVAAEVARVLMGKHRPQYTPYLLTGDYVIVVNAAKAVVTGNKAADKFYYHYSGYRGGLTKTSYEDMLERHPEHALRKAVKGMLPKNFLAVHMLKRLKIYPGPDHPHQAQVAGSQKEEAKAS
ncbi:MAG: 50S ribosomal protein L13 [Chloroflexi bacterium]|nr:50S ribosomal protein L13 [Chloroflexota bacterium]